MPNNMLLLPAASTNNRAAIAHKNFLLKKKNRKKEPKNDPAWYSISEPHLLLRIFKEKIPVVFAFQISTLKQNPKKDTKKRHIICLVSKVKP